MLVEDAGDVVRMDAVDGERKDAETPLPRRYQPHARKPRQLRDAVFGERRLMRLDRIEAEMLDVIERRCEADRAGDIGRAGLKPCRRVLESRLLESYI